MKNQSKILLLIIVLISCNIQELTAQINFVSGEVKEIFSLLPQTLKEQVISTSEQKSRFGLFKTVFNGQTLEIDVRYNNKKEVEHIGFFVFNDDKNFRGIREVLDYVERSVLVSLLKKEEFLLKDETFKHDIEVKVNGLTLNNQNKLSALPKIDFGKSTQLNIKHNEEAFLFEWKLDVNTMLSIKVPNNYTTITGRTKDVLEKLLLDQIKNSKNVKLETTFPDKSQLKLVSGDIYLLPGQIYSTTPELSSAKYYQLTESIEPVFDRIHYRESIRNMFLNLINSTLNLNLTQKMYGGIDEKYTVNINNFNANFADDFNVYFGWQIDSKEKLKASVLFSHKIYNYNHLLIITPNYKTFFKKDAEIDGILITYIPREKQISPVLK